MTSLSEAYERQTAEVSRSRVLLGTGLFAAGALLLIAGILTATTTIATDMGLTVFGARELAGVLAGLGLPAVLVGVFSVLPASRVQRATAAVGAGVAVAGVALFRYTYPNRWFIGGSEGIPSTLTLATTVVYFAGAVVTFWTMFAALATFKRRNDPGGTVTLTVTRGGETRTVEVAAEDADKAREAFGSTGGGVGVVGTNQETVPTQTGPGASASDGGTTSRDITSVADDDAEVMEPPTDPGDVTDRYCGNCTHFEYVRTDEGIQPYCGFHDELMDDMEACSEWTPAANAE